MIKIVENDITNSKYRKSEVFKESNNTPVSTKVQLMMDENNT